MKNIKFKYYILYGINVVIVKPESDTRNNFFYKTEFEINKKYNKL